MNKPTAVFRTVAAIPRPASCGVPRCPTIVESMTVKSGSAMSAPKDGRARERILFVVIVGIDEALVPSSEDGEVCSAHSRLLLITRSSVCPQHVHRPVESGAHGNCRWLNE